MNLDYWLSKFESKSAEQLQDILDNAQLYQTEAVEAAKRMLGAAPFEGQNLEEPENDIIEFPESSLEYKLPIVSRLLRLVHYVVDYVVIQIAATGTSQVLQLSSYTYSLELGSVNLETSLVNFYLIMIIYYFIFEWKAQRTLGKYLTKTIVVNELGESLSAYIAFIRTISRLIPFEAFSCLVNPSLGWHDRFSKTYVINEEELTRFKTEMQVGQHIADHLIP